MLQPSQRRSQHPVPKIPVRSNPFEPQHKIGRRHSTGLYPDDSPTCMLRTVGSLAQQAKGDNGTEKLSGIRSSETCTAKAPIVADAATSLDMVEFTSLDDATVVPAPSSHVFLGTNNQIKINVGGTVFVTTYSTLTRNHRSMFSGMFSGQFGLEKGEDGSYFIDRDPTYFSHVLNYLRDGLVNLKIMDAGTKVNILKEARFYQVLGLIQLLQLDLKKTKSHVEEEIEKTYAVQLHVKEDDLSDKIEKMTIEDDWHFESWVRSCTTEAHTYHVLFSKLITKSDIMLLERISRAM